MNSILCPRAFCRLLLLTLLTVLVPYFVMAATSQNETPVLPGTLEAWMDAEARLNDKEGLGAPPRDHLALNDEFRAENEKWFRVPSYWIPESALETAEADALIPRDLKAELYRYRKGQREFRLFVHPQSIDFYKNFVNRYPRADDGLARATASSRSVLMTLSNNTQVFFFAKLSLDLNLGYHDRTIPATEAIRSVGTSIYAQRMSPKLSPGFKFIPEVIGIFPKGWTRGGQIIRPVPAEILKGKVKVLPLFALTKLENGTTLLEQMAEISGDAAPDFARTAILAPFVKAWVSWAMDGGITMEAHGQNVLFSVNQLGLPTGEFYQRDMGGTTIDFDSKAFPKEMRMEFPHFSEFGTYYELSQKSKRIQTSLGVYFQDRVLNNIDRELQRVAPGYVPGQIISQLWIELQNEIIRHTGIDRNQIPIEKLKTDLGTILRNGARRTSNRPVFSAPSTKSCESIF